MVDANILYSASGWQRWPHEVLGHAVKGDFQLVLSQRVVDEAETSISADFPQRLGVFRRLLATTKPEIVPEPGERQKRKNSPLLPDPDDIPIALAAINAKVDYFISEDKHFTTKDAARAEFHRKVKVMLSGTFLREVMDWTSEQLEKVRKR